MANLIDPDLLRKQIELHLRARMAEIAVEETEKAKKEIERRIAAELDLLALRVVREYQVERRGEHVIIEVRKP